MRKRKNQRATPKPPKSTIAFYGPYKIFTRTNPELRRLEAYRALSVTARLLLWDWLTTYNAASSFDTRDITTAGGLQYGHAQCGEAGLSKSVFYRARQELVERGWIILTGHGPGARVLPSHSYLGAEWTKEKSVTLVRNLYEKATRCPGTRICGFLLDIVETICRVEGLPLPE